MNVKRKLLAKVVNHLESAYEIMGNYGNLEKRMLYKYAEYFVALKLLEHGFDVQIGSERKVKNAKNADIFLPNEKIRVEVKSSIYKPQQEGWAASFGNGTQITKEKFDFCVFITYDKNKWWKVDKIFVFTRDELTEIVKPRYELAAFKNNACLLLYHGNYENYSAYVNVWEETEYDIEIRLNKSPEKYHERWDKIK